MPHATSNSILRRIGCCREGCCNKECFKHHLKRRLPIIKWMPTITLTSFLYDLAGGLTVGLTAVPQSLAYAQLASMPLENGLYTTIISGFTYFLLGTARDVNLGPTSLISLLTGSIVDEVGALVHAILCFFAGLIMILFGFLRLEIFLNIFPISVTTGFTSAAAILIVGSQLKYFFGIPKLPRPFIQLIPEFFKKINQTNLWDLVGGVLVLGFLLIVQHTVPIILAKLNKRKQTRCVKVLSTSITVFATLRAIIAIIVSAAVGFTLLPPSASTSNGLSIDCISNATFNCSSNVMFQEPVKSTKPKQGLTLTGPVPRGVPRPELPPFGGLYVKRRAEDKPKMNCDVNSTKNSTNNAGKTDSMEFLSFNELMSRIGIGTIIIPLIATIELLAIGRALAQRNGYTIDASQELFACGTAHVIGAFLNAYPSSSSITRSALNSQCEVKTQLCSFFTSALVLLAAATIADTTLPYVPKSCLAAVVIAAALSMIETHMAKMIWRVNKVDIIPTAITFVACLLLDIEYGILIGVVAALVITSILSMRSVRTNTTIKETKLAAISAHTDQRCLLITMAEGELRYPCADSLKKLWVKTAGHVGPVVIDCSAVREVDFSTIMAILQLAKNPTKKGALSGSFPLCFVGFEGRLLEKMKNAVETLKFSPPSYRAIYFAGNLLETVSLFDQLNASDTSASMPADGFKKYLPGGVEMGTIISYKSPNSPSQTNLLIPKAGSNLATIEAEAVQGDDIESQFHTASTTMKKRERRKSM